MRKFAYLCLILPTLNVRANAMNQAKKDIVLKSATTIKASQKDCSGSFHEGRCYIFDETEPKLVLKNVQYKLNGKNELIVDLKISEKDQKRLKKVSAKFAGKRHLVIMINDQVVSAPFLRSAITGQHLQVSLKNRTDVNKFLTALAR